MPVSKRRVKNGIEETRILTGGVNNSVAKTLPLDTFIQGQTNNHVWMVPRQEGLLGMYTPPSKITPALSVQNVSTAIAATDSSGNTLALLSSVDDGKVVSMVSSGAEGSTIKSGLTITSKRVAMAVFRDYIHCYNGSDTPFKIQVSNSAVTNIGVTQPSTTAGAGMSLTNNGAGNVKGIVVYYIAEVSGTTEGAVSSLDTTNLQVDAGDGSQIDVVFPNNAAYNSKVFNVYRSASNEYAPQQVGQITVGATGGTFSDNIPDHQLGDLPELHGDAPPSTAHAIAVYQDRVYILDCNNLYFSDIGNGESFYTTTDGNVIAVGEGDGDVGTALAVDEAGVIIFKKDHIYRLSGEGPSTFRIDPVVPSDSMLKTVGTPHVASLATIPGGVAFYHKQGVYILSVRFGVRRISAPLEWDWYGNNTVINDEAVALFYDHRFNHLLFSAGFGAIDADLATPSVCFIFDLDTGTWVGTGQAFKTAMVHPDVPRVFATLFDGSSADDVYSLIPDQDMQTGTATSLSASAVILPLFIGEGYNTHRRYLWADIVHQGSGNITVTPTIDGTGITGTALTGPGVGTRDRQRVNIGQRGDELQLKISSAAGQAEWGVHSVSVVYQEMPGESV